jgi:hypothetical protein
MFTLELYKSTMTASTLTQVTSVYSGVVPTLNSGFQVPSLQYLMGVAGVGGHLHRLQSQAPSLRPFPYPDWMPVNVGTAIESPVKGVFIPHNPIKLNYTEELDSYAYSTSAETVYTMVQFCDGPVTQAPAQRMITVHGTASTTLTAGGWTTVPITLDSALPAGVYNLVGARAYSATCLFFKVIPAMGSLFQPGSTGVQTYDALDAPGARYGGFGTWLTFQQNVLPSFNFFATSADTAEEVWLDLTFAGGSPVQQAS